jgi:hypothetical protein
MNNKSLLFSAFMMFGLGASAQDAGKAYAITGDGTGDYMWMNIRQVNVNTGQVTGNVFERNKTAYSLLDADTRKPVENMIQVSSPANPAASYSFANSPTASMVAAAAYDKNHDKLFFTPMRIGELRWLDLGAGGDALKFYSVKSPLLNTGDLMTDESNQITRMVIGADGNGYAMTNDANHLIRFTTGKKTTITDLGNIIDAESNSLLSIHNKCSSWGGDMVADAYNKLYVITASHNVFVVDVDTRIATYKGTITGLPPTYTTNGAAVDADGKVVVCSANSFSGYYKFDIGDLKATLIEGSDKVYNASDLANGNLLLQKEADAVKNMGVPALKSITPVLNSDAHVYPNPVTNNEFKVLFDGQASGKYMISLTDLSGRAILTKEVFLSAKGQVETVQISSTLAKGVYMVKVTDASNQFVFTDKIVVQ